MLEIVKPGININFIKLRRIAFAFSALVIGIGLLSLVMKGGLNYGIDFTGGMMVHVGFEDDISIGQVRSAVAEVGLGDISVQEFGTQGHEYLLRVPSGDSSVGGGRAATIKEALRESLPASGFKELRTEIVGPRVGKELRRRGILSVLFATLMMGAYIAFRFQLRFGVGAGIALLHDVLVTIGALSLANVEIDLSVVAGLLTVVGYSVNDTVVVSDRIRENMKKFSRDDMASLINSSINETLSRTVLTTGTSLMVLFALFFVGGGVIHGFAYTLIIGLSVGTYSSVFIASPVVEYMKAGER
ncbi:MAG: protein translocase subunit SecF [Proteobacteria bacterium]|nr:protein translocase subunit SecF [Pseudomonadota bacterium]